MQSTSAIWAKDKRHRIIRTYRNEYDMSVVRLYGSCDLILKDWVKSVGLEQMTLTLSSTSSREIWNHNIPREEVRKIAEQFKKSAEKSNFEFLGVVKR